MVRKQNAFVRELGIVLAILVLAAVLRAWGLAGKSFWVDEILAVERSRSLRQAVAFCSLNHEPPLRYFLVHYLARLHPPELFTRLPSYLFGVGTIAVLWLVGRMLFGAPVGVVAASLLAISSWHIVQCQDARMYAVMMFFWTLSLVLFYRALEKPTEVMWWPALAIVHAVNFYLSYLTVFVLVAEILTLIGWLAVRKWRERAAFALKPYATGALIFAGFFGMFVSFWFNPIVSLIERYTGAGAPSVEPLVRAVHPRRETIEIVGWPAQFDAAFLLGVLDRTVVPGIVGRIVALVGLSAGLSLCWRRNRPFVWIVALSFFIAIATILFTEMKRFVAARYVFHLLLFSGILLAVAIVATVKAVLTPIGGRAKRVFVTFLLALLVLVTLVRYYPYLMIFVRCERQDWRTACRWIADRAKPDDVILTGAWGTYEAVLYYGQPALTEHHAVIRCLSANSTLEEIERVPSSAGVWYITWGYLPEEIRSVIEDKMKKAIEIGGLDGTIEILRRKQQ